MVCHLEYGVIGGGENVGISQSMLNHPNCGPSRGSMITGKCVSRTHLLKYVQSTRFFNVY